MILLKIVQTFFLLLPRYKLPLPPVRPGGKNGRPITFIAYLHLDELEGNQGTTSLPKDCELYLCYKA